MDRRFKLLCLSAAAGVTAGGGCKTAAGPAAGGPGGANPVAGVGRFFDVNKPATAGPVAEAPVVREARKPGQGFKPDTEVELAKVSLEAAMTQTTAAERDPLIDSARQRLARALKADPHHAGAAATLARLYAAVGDKAAAVATLEDACRRHPQDHDLLRRLAGTQFLFGDHAQAEQSIRAALALDPKNRGYVKTLALCRAHQDDWDGAFGTLVTTNVMTQPEARYFLGRTLIEVGRPDDGRAQIAEAVKLDPEYALATQTLADLDAGRLAPAAGGVVTAGHAEPR